jgi:hypothetical protein
MFSVIFAVSKYHMSSTQLEDIVLVTGDQSAGQNL